MIRKIAFSILVTLIPMLSIAQLLDPVEWKISSNRVSDTEYDMVFTASMEDGWAVYSQHTDDGGPIPTTIEYEQLEGAELQGNASETGDREEGADPMFDGVNVIKFKYTQPFVITQRVKLTDASARVVGYLTYMTCNDETCLPPTDVEFNFGFEAKPIESPKDTSPKKEDKNIEAIANTESVNAEPKEEESMIVSEQYFEEEMPQDFPSNVQWNFDVNNAGDAYEIRLKGDIDPGYKIYSHFIQDGGPLPTELIFEPEDAIERIEKKHENGHKKEEYDELFEMDVITFDSEEPYELYMLAHVAEGVSQLSGIISYMICDDATCVPGEDEFSLDLVGGSGGLASLISESDFIDGNVIDQRRQAIISTLEEPLSSCGGEQQSDDQGILWTFILGFLGGLVALLTPCVFPMIPLTVSFFTKDTKRSGWMNGLIYGLSIIVIYVTIGLLITALFGEEALNRLSTNWIANVLFFLIFIFFAFSFFGYYEITLPSSWTNKSDKMADKGGLIGIFFMAFTLSLVSFSCTGPIIGSALVQSATSPIGPFVVMLGFSTALAIPFGLFAAFPSWLNSLPRSGSWMNSVKVVLGFLEVALAFKFLSVADLTNHWGFLRYELFMAIWVLVFLGLTLYLFGFIQFPHDSPVKKLSPVRKLLAFGSLALTLYLCTGFFYNDTIKSYNTLPLLSGLAPPANYNYFLPEPELDPVIKAKYPSYSKCANDIDCFKDYYEGLAYAREVNKPLFVDFTGYGCANCRKTEEHIWVDEGIRQSLKQDFVMASLYVDDDEKYEEVLISKTRNKKLRNVGSKWADFQIVNFQQNSQPLYIILNTDEEVVSPPRGYQEGITSYKAFLDCGLGFLSQ